MTAMIKDVNLVVETLLRARSITFIEVWIPWDSPL